MSIRFKKAAAQANFSRFQPLSDKGFYESFFIRANHPTLPQAFWIRYTLFCPVGRPDKRMGELWAIFFDGEDITTSKEEFPIQDCNFPDTHFTVSVGNSTINSKTAVGKAGEINWNLNYSTQTAPFFFFPLYLYHSPLPKAKSIASQPYAFFDGTIQVGNKTLVIDNWAGSQNHNWGERHTDAYAWGQVVGFDNSPQTFLEVATAKLQIGQFDAPAITILILQHEGKRYELNSPLQWKNNKATYHFFEWEFECQSKEITIKGKIKAPKAYFVGLRYYNPIGGYKCCLNTKIAQCELEIKKTGQNVPQALYSANGVAFEILTDEEEEKHHVPIHF